MYIICLFMDKNIIHAFVAKIGIPLAEILWIFLRLKIIIILIKLFAPLRFPTNLRNQQDLRANIFSTIGICENLCGKINQNQSKRIHQHKITIRQNSLFYFCQLIRIFLTQFRKNFLLITFSNRKNDFSYLYLLMKHH